VAQIIYTTDGSTPSPTNGTVYGGAFSVAASTTISYRAYDFAGNAELPNVATIQIDTVPPTSSVSCNGGACSTAFYGAAVSVALSASDNPGGSGVQEIVYTTDGSVPSQTNGSVYSGPFFISNSTVLNYRSFDVAGNAEPMNTATIQVDTVPPTSRSACNGAPCSSGYYSGVVSVTLSASDNPGGSGVQEIVYTTDGSAPSLTNGTIYSGPFTVASTTTVKYRSYDIVGNAEATNSTTINIDSVPPSTSLASPTGGSILTGSVTLTATATDNVSVSQVTFLVNGQQVGTGTNSSGSTYSLIWNSASIADGTYQVTVKAIDEAGNSATSGPATVYIANHNLLQNPSLETASGSTPTCWLLGGYGTNTYTWSRTSNAHTGSWAENLLISSFTSGDRKMVNTQDSGTCAPAISSGHTYLVTAWYEANITSYLYVYYLQNGTWVYWAQSPGLPTSTSWRQATLVTPPIPAGATNISVGMGGAAVGSITMDDFSVTAAS
jgi:hypothetical protein